MNIVYVCDANLRKRKKSSVPSRSTTHSIGYKMKNEEEKKKKKKKRNYLFSSSERKEL